MSRHNKVNPDHYTIAGRLTPDDWARERRKQNEQLFGETRRRRSRKPVPPWMANEQGGGPENVEPPEPGDAETAVPLEERDQDEAAQRPEAGPKPNAAGRHGAGGGKRKKTQRRAREREPQQTTSGTTMGARSAKAKPRSTKNARAASPQRAGRPAARQTRSRGSQKSTAKKAATSAASRKGARTAKKR